MREPEREAGRASARGGRRERGEPARGREGRGRGEVAARGREGRGRAEPGAGRRERSERPRPIEGAVRGREGRGRSEGRGDDRRREDRPMRAAPATREPELEQPRERFEPPRERFEPPRERGDEATREPGIEAGREERSGAPSEGRRRRRGRRGRGGGEPRPGRGEGARPVGAPVEERDERAPRDAEPMREAPAFEPEEMGPPMAPERGPAGFEAREHPVSEHPEHEEPRETGPAMSSDELAATGKRIAEELFTAMGFEATVTARAEADHVDVTAGIASGEDLLTGRKGEVRQALQHLLNRMLNRGEGSRYHLQLEINEFWKRREDELRAIAHELAEEALESQGEAVTEYLNAQERRIVHVALKEDSRVKTYALGTGLIKRVAVAPADYPEGPRQD
jgi:spoIIIJ-associated protein